MDQLGTKTSHYIISAVALTTALSWNGTIRQGIDSYFPQPESEILAGVIYALIMTMFLILLVHYLPDTSSEIFKPDRYEKSHIRS
jgi:hypothetical protein